MRLELLERIARTFTGYPEAGWALIHRTIEKGLPSLEPARRLVTLADCHRKLRQENAKTVRGLPDTTAFQLAGRPLGDPQLAMRLFGKC
jgi:hypothetical protein